MSKRKQQSLAQFGFTKQPKITNVKHSGVDNTSALVGNINSEEEASEAGAAGGQSDSVHQLRGGRERAGGGERGGAGERDRRRALAGT